LPDNQTRRSRGVSRAVLEFTTIVVGVLVALAVDQWADDRAAHGLEGIYLDRLIQEVAEDTAVYSFRLGVIAEKEASLQRVDAFLRRPEAPLSDPEHLLRDISQATGFAWGSIAPMAVTATYDDLRGSGNLGLIRQPSVRIAIVRYYDRVDEMDRRIEVRRTPFPDVSYGLFPRTPGELGENSPDLSISDAEVGQIVGEVRRSDLGRHVTAEVNRARFMATALTDLQADALTLLGELESYRQSR